MRERTAKGKAVRLRFVKRKREKLGAYIKNKKPTGNFGRLYLIAVFSS